ncbi:MAG: histidinol dehydrogenase [Saprospiraceae bacterium]|nr:histidinol dehydrogenase [Saprospiraceae bacterium]
MKKITHPKRKTWEALAQRPQLESQSLTETVREIFDAIAREGEQAVRQFTRQFDGVDQAVRPISEKRLEAAGSQLRPELRAAMALAERNIRKFHERQREKAREMETLRGVRCWRESRPIGRVGLYIPGGSAPLFSTVLMLGVPARLAGCPEVVLCSPPDRAGNIHPAVLHAAWLTGIRRVYAVGGVQAIAAMSLGAGSIPAVDKLFGPGNQYVTAAKQYAQQLGLAIDLPAGPSELLVVADSSADPEFVAADLLAQAEHGPDSQVLLVSDSAALVDQSLQALNRQLALLPRSDIARQALQHSRALVFKTLDRCIEFSNLYAPEHLILAVKKPRKLTAAIQNAGSVFLGHYSCESAGDYASGTNHTLPTNGWARNHSGVSLDSFVKKITFQELSKNGLRRIGPAIEQMAEAEQLQAHKNAVSIRLRRLNQSKGAG